MADKDWLRQDEKEQGKPKVVQIMVNFKNASN